MAIEKKDIKIVHVPFLGEPNEKIRERCKEIVKRDYGGYRLYRYFPPKVYAICRGRFDCENKKCQVRLYSTNEFTFYL